MGLGVGLGAVLSDPETSAGQALPDSLALPDSVTAIQHHFSDEPYSVGAVLDSMPPARGYYLDPTAALADVPGAFSYSLGNLGWPHQWSYLGMPPSSVDLSFDGITVRDPVTNRALFDAIPVDLIDRQRESALAHGGPVLLQSRIRSLAAIRPYTELRYEKGGAGLQSISAIHVQQRSGRILGVPTVTRFAARFAFHEWNGQYPNSGSDLSQAFGRIGFTSQRWRIRISDSYTQRTRGAHSGVLEKPGEGFDSVFDRFDARVGNPSAQQQLERNQFDVSVEHTWETDIKPLAIWSSYTKWRYRYTDEEESEARSTEVRLKVEQESPEFIEGHEVTGRFSIEMVDISSDGLLAGGGGSTKSRLIMSADDRFTRGELAIRGMIGLHTVDEWVFPTGGLQLRRTFEKFSISAEAALNGIAPSPLEHSGGLGVTAAAQTLTQTKSQSIRVSLDAPGRVFGLEITGFVSRLIDPVDIVRSGDSHFVVQSSGSVTWTGIKAALGWRTLSQQGFYGSFSPTIQSATSSVHDEVIDGLASSLPYFFGTARFGYRNQFFLGDLDADLYLLGRFWSGFESRVYDPVHALLVLPGAEAATYGGSGTLDVRFTAGIRGTTISLSVDNVLAGILYPGALIVPVYPLPARAFRFGVFWPIND